MAKGLTYISGSVITINSGDDAIKGEQKVTIDGGKIDVKTSVEGIEAPIININDGINASASLLSTSPVITINGGKLTVEVGPGDTDALDSNGDIYINGGEIALIAQMSSIDYDGTAELNGGTVTVNGTKITAIPSSIMGGGGPGGRMQR